ncbi:hypothetical protein [Gracilimonas mengyeensis]|nr:hypothetical protein [Gracilimonas mengyeensis]
MTILALFMIWTGVHEIRQFHSVLQEAPAEVESQNTFEVGPLMLTKTSAGDDLYRYVTVTDLKHTPSPTKADEMLTTANSDRKVLGLVSSPSFKLSKEHLGFWKSQFYLELGLRVGGWLMILLFFIGMTITNFRQKKKLFTPAIYRWFLGLYFFTFAGFLAKAILYGRLMYFLNHEFYLQESLTAGISTNMALGLALFFFLILFLQKAIPMQKEQDLTV